MSLFALSSSISKKVAMLGGTTGAAKMLTPGSMCIVAPSATKTAHVIAYDLFAA